MRFISRFKSLLAIAVLVSSFAAIAAEPSSTPILRLDSGSHTAQIRRIATNQAGRWLVSASDDKTARVWDTADGRLLTTLRIPIGSGNEGKLFAVALSPNGQTVALGGWTGWDYDGSTSIFLYDRASGRLLRRLSGLPSTIFHLAFSPDGRSLAAMLSGKNGMRLFSVADGQMIAEDRNYGGDSYFVDFSTDGRLVTTSFDGLLRLYRFDGQRLSLLAKRAAPGGAQPMASRFSPDSNRIAVGFNDTPAVNVLNTNDLAFEYAPDTEGVSAGMVGVAWSLDGQTLFAAGLADQTFSGVHHRYIRRWTRAGRGAAVNWPVADQVIMDLVPLSSGRLAFGGADTTVGILDENGSRLLFQTSAVADFRDNQTGFTLSYDGSKVGFGYELYGKSPVVFDSQSRALLAPDTPNLLPPVFSSSDISVTDWKYTFSPRLNGTVLMLAPNEPSYSFALLQNGAGVVLGGGYGIRAYDRYGNLRWQQPAPGPVFAVNVSQDGRWVVAAYGDGTIRWHRASDGVEQLAFYPHPDKKRWVMWTPSGYYDASPGAEDLIGWHLNRGKDNAADFFPASRFRNQFNRPDVITKVLDIGSETEALRLANAEAGRKTQVASIIQVLPPVVEIVSPNEGATVSTASITLKYSTRSPDDAPVTGLRVRVNGMAVTLPDARNLTVTTTGKPAAAGAREITLPIPPQDSEIQLFAENKNGVSTPATLRVTWAGKKAAPTEEDSRFKPKLYVLSVGVSKYKNPDYNLGLAAKDATDFAAVFQKQDGKLYGKVTVHLLTDDKASKESVIEGLEWLKSQVTSRDVGVMFIAGHGMNDNTGKYFFLPHNANPDKLMSTGVAQTDIKDTLNSLAGKAVFFVDTCHAGNALGSGKTRAIGGSTDAFVNELASAENGVIVFSSSTGRQLSQEDPKWGNGAFTKAVVEGLSGKAEIGKSGKVTHKGLDYYVSERVKELTKGQQSPVSIAPGGVTDFPIAVVGR